MKKFLLGTALLPCILLGELHFQCVSHPDSHTTVTTYFTDQTPIFSQKTTVKDLTGKIVSEVETSFFSSTSVCGIQTEFKTGCGTNIMTEGPDFNYSFRCDNAFGDLVFLKDSRAAYFRCQGETVMPSYHDRTFENCE